MNVLLHNPPGFILIYVGIKLNIVIHITYIIIFIMASTRPGQLWSRSDCVFLVSGPLREECENAVGRFAENGFSRSEEKQLQSCQGNNNARCSKLRKDIAAKAAEASYRSQGSQRSRRNRHID